jgi:PIN domain nuclease of toxin-antitoxin system
MIRAVADTHAVVWYLYDDPRLSKVSRSWIETAAASGNQIGLSSITLAEIIYLIEKGRIDERTLARLLAELDATDAVLVEIPFDRRVAEVLGQVPRSQVPDLPDRIIAATALSIQAPVISRDRRIQTSHLTTVW